MHSPSPFAFAFAAANFFFDTPRSTAIQTPLWSCPEPCASSMGRTTPREVRSSSGSTMRWSAAEKSRQCMRRPKLK